MIIDAFGVTIDTVPPDTTFNTNAPLRGVTVTESTYTGGRLVRPSDVRKCEIRQADLENGVVRIASLGIYVAFRRNSGYINTPADEVVASLQANTTNPSIAPFGIIVGQDDVGRVGTIYTELYGNFFTVPVMGVAGDLTSTVKHIKEQNENSFSTLDYDDAQCPDGDMLVYYRTVEDDGKIVTHIARACIAGFLDPDDGILTFNGKYIFSPSVELIKHKLKRVGENEEALDEVLGTRNFAYGYTPKKTKRMYVTAAQSTEIEKRAAIKAKALVDNKEKLLQAAMATQKDLESKIKAKEEEMRVLKTERDTARSDLKMSEAKVGHYESAAFRESCLSENDRVLRGQIQGLETDLTVTRLERDRVREEAAREKATFAAEKKAAEAAHELKIRELERKVEEAKMHPQKISVERDKLRHEKIKSYIGIATAIGGLIVVFQKPLGKLFSSAFGALGKLFGNSSN